MYRPKCPEKVCPNMMMMVVVMMQRDLEARLHNVRMKQGSCAEDEDDESAVELKDEKLGRVPEGSSASGALSNDTAHGEDSDPKSNARAEVWSSESVQRAIQSKEEVLDTQSQPCGEHKNSSEGPVPVKGLTLESSLIESQPGFGHQMGTETQDDDDGPLGALSNDVVTLRTMIATLKTGVQFVRCVLAALPEVGIDIEDLKIWQCRVHGTQVTVKPQMVE